MGYKPTLGGLKKAQDFFSTYFCPLPIFQMNIYDDGQFVGMHWEPGQGQTITIDEAILKYGAGYEVVNVRLTNESGDRFIEFCDLCYCSILESAWSKEKDYDVFIRGSKKNLQDHGFEDFMSSIYGEIFINLARWGKPAPSMLDFLKFHFFPKRYVAKVFV